MNEVSRIIDELDRAYDGDPWHGPPLLAVLSGVTASQAAARPAVGSHSIWEIVRHLISWKDTVRRRIDGEPTASPIEGDWPPVADSGETAWADALASLGRAQSSLREAVARLDETKLRELVGADRDPAAGTGTSTYVTLHGLAQHDAYHAGQIAILKKGVP